ncbi:MAG: hypothetical protein H6662_05895 [Ardenticatenaceae bacterium]|nr:hypothetical protein [Anaerolineales bacterium]MCB8921097.1 hypothetical protein [Ardenticatenaceae bacterium]
MKRKIEHNYRAFLLRLWRDDTDMPWRASLENPHTGERQHFAKPEYLMAFLIQQMSDEPPQDGER